MDVNPLVRKGTNLIQSYKDGALKIAGVYYDHPVIVSADTILRWDESFDNLPACDVFILGTGHTQVWPPAELRTRLPLEVMATPAACRTYNALVSEGRDVIALLVPVSQP